MPKTLAEGRTKLSFLAAKPTNPAAMTVAQANAGIDFSCAVLASDYRLSPTDSDRIDGMKALCDEGNVRAMGSSNYEAGMSFFRFLTTGGASDTPNDTAFTTFTGKGVTGYFAERVGKKSTDPWAAGDLYDLYEVVADNPQKPQDQAGYIRFRQPFEVGGLVVLRGVVAA